VNGDNEALDVLTKLGRDALDRVDAMEQPRQRGQDVNGFNSITWNTFD